MEHKYLSLISLLLILLLIPACSLVRIAEGSSLDKNSSSDEGVKDQAHLVAELRTRGATVEIGETIEQPFFTVSGQSLKINGVDVQVYEYASTEAMQADTAQVSADGSSVGTSMVTWVSSPHFFKLGQLLVLYVGDDSAIIDVLKSTLGEQFAGR
ncbi:MAG: hypothetical protein A2029_05020 [Chloroflexi bacterium RBG_19FT_COMBO_47_9]|nr:MAG: hypothetical protein A2029_05020 [Chloroflexi bacterium RBG_19FT_COMBO_47_9]